MRTTSILTLFLFSTVAMAEDQHVLQRAKIAHTQARQSIHSIQATMKITTVAEKNHANVIARTCQWIESGTSLRWEITKIVPHGEPTPKRGKNKPPDVKVEQVSIGVQKDGKRTTYWKRRENDKLIAKQGVILASTEPMEVDLWSGAGFIVLDNPRTSLQDILQKDDGHTSAAWISAGNRKTILVRHMMPDRTIESHLAPEYGYLVQRMLSTTLQNGKPAICCLLEVEGVKNYGPDLFFPTKTIETFYRHDSGIGNAFARSTFVFEDVRINEAIDSSAFELKIPKGVRVVDKTKDVGYVMGDGGKPDPKHPVVPVAHYNPQNDSKSTSTATTTRLRHKSKLLFGAILGVTVIFLLVVRFRYKKRRTT